MNRPSSSRSPLDTLLVDDDAEFADRIARSLREDELRKPSLAVHEDVDLMLNKPIEAELLGGLIEYICRRRRDTVTPHGSP